MCLSSWEVFYCKRLERKSDEERASPKIRGKATRGIEYIRVGNVHTKKGVI